MTYLFKLIHYNYNKKTQHLKIKKLIYYFNFQINFQILHYDFKKPYGLQVKMFDEEAPAEFFGFIPKIFQSEIYNNMTLLSLRIYFYTLQKLI